MKAFHFPDFLSRQTPIHPDLLLFESNAMVSALWFWNKYKLNELADKDDIMGITKRINGGTNGLEHRKQLLEKWKNIV